MLQNCALIRYIPGQVPDGDLYESLKCDDLSGHLATKLFEELATKIEETIPDAEPFEISLVGLKPYGSPVLLIGIARPDRIESILIETELTFETHVRQSYPAVFANDFDRNQPPSQSILHQLDVPPMGASCGLLNNDRHTVSLGSYLYLSARPRSIYMLTVPPTYAHKMSVGDVITQPSVADREKHYTDENEICKDVINADPTQGVALQGRRELLQETFELGRVIAASDRPTLSQACQWVVAEVTRTTALKAMMEARPRSLPFMSIRPTQVRTLEAELIVSKQGRTTNHTIGTVNGIKSLYRLPHDGRGVRRHDYIVLSHPWGGTFAYPGDSGAIVYAHEPSDIEGHSRIKSPGVPCGIIVAASTNGHVTFVQALDPVLSNIERKGLGKATFLSTP